MISRVCIFLLMMESGELKVVHYFSVLDLYETSAQPSKITDIKLSVVFNKVKLLCFFLDINLP